MSDEPGRGKTHCASPLSSFFLHGKEGALCVDQTLQIQVPILALPYMTGGSLASVLIFFASVPPHLIRSMLVTPSWVIVKIK